MAACLLFLKKTLYYRLPWSQVKPFFFFFRRCWTLIRTSSAKSSRPRRYLPIPRTLPLPNPNPDPNCEPPTRPEVAMLDHHLPEIAMPASRGTTPYSEDVDSSSDEEPDER